MGFGVSKEIIKPDPHKIDMMRNKSTPTSCADFNAHLGILQKPIVVLNMNLINCSLSALTPVSSLSALLLLKKEKYLHALQKS